ncbi:hypothetical protein [Chryseobacterium camelliae]|uniref:hypothetical protein n=1 Tax=Chryseobacterium camelliae TaxID=1265445 RepID=UPI000C1CB552|nr:hypothetical protein [Chryseobacterium camelliae]
MKNIILVIFFAFLSCKEKEILTEKKVIFSDLVEPQRNIYVKLLSYYSAAEKSQSNFYLVKNIHNGDTLYVIDKDDQSVCNFIRNYNGVHNTNLSLQKSKLKEKKEYIINIPQNYILNNKKLYLAELIRLID